jgi:hypothetical protein
MESSFCSGWAAGTVQTGRTVAKLMSEEIVGIDLIIAQEMGLGTGGARNQLAGSV